LNKSSSSQDAAGPVQLDETGCQRLAVAVILLAVAEAVDPDPDIYYPARKWLASDGLIWVGLLGMNPQPVCAWIKQGCPKRSRAAYQDENDRYLELLHWCEIIAAKKRKPPPF
jgi:hypothetical protein